MNILYLHGLGGGSTSRVPNRLRTELSRMHFTKEGEPIEFNVICETYDFDPEVASRQIAQWVEAYHLDLVIGESMGSIHALGIKGVPHIYISPALNFDRGTEMARPVYAVANALGINLVPKPRGPKRQVLLGEPELLAKFKPMIQSYKEAILSSSQRDLSFAFFGNKDQYMLPGIVSVKEYERLFGKTYEVHEGGHIFGVSYVKPKLIPKIVEMLRLEMVRVPCGYRKQHKISVK